VAKLPPIKLASLPAAFVALYRAHDASPDLASALLDMNSAAFVSAWAVSQDFVRDFAHFRGA
jgi:hypothetical protein